LRRRRRRRRGGGRSRLVEWVVGWRAISSLSLQEQ
jgi:hypothetical protein